MAEAGMAGEDGIAADGAAAAADGIGATRTSTTMAPIMAILTATVTAVIMGGAILTTARRWAPFWLPSSGSLASIITLIRRRLRRRCSIARTDRSFRWG